MRRVKEELKYVVMVLGVQCVMTTGESMMPKLSADNWDLPLLVSNSHS